MRIFSAILGKSELQPPLLYAITDRSAFPELDPFRYLELACRSPAHLLQWREKDLDPEQSRPLIQYAVRLARSRGKVLLINSHADLAQEAGADGVHVPAYLDLNRLRAAVPGEQLIWGKSVHSPAEAMQAEAEGADYVLLGPIFAPLSKPALRPSLGLETLKETVGLLKIPVFALGGLELRHFEQVFRSGAAGVAGISWLQEEIRRLAGPIQ